MSRSFARIAALLLAVSAGTAIYAGVGQGFGSHRVNVLSSRSRFETTVYFLTDGGRAPFGVRRTLVKLPPDQGASLRAALGSLFAGPKGSEQHAGVTSAIPPGTRLLSLTFEGRDGTDAVLNLHGLPAAEPAWRTAQIIAQIARTTIGLSGIGRVWLRDDGSAWGLRNFQGRIKDVPHDYSELLGFNIGTPNGTFSALP